MKSSKKTVGIIINPIAGIGGRVGMKGSDGARAQERALRLGAVPLAPARAEEAIAALLEIKDEINILAAPGCMGEDICQKLGLSVNTVGVKTSDKTSAQDTESVAQEMVAAGVNLLLFVGGDGTARNIYTAIGVSIPVIGIPAGVKIHSAVYAKTPKAAGRLAVLFLTDKVRTIRTLEVMDLDEDAYRDNRVAAKLYGYLLVPYETSCVQRLKMGGFEQTTLNGIASQVLDEMLPDWYYVLGAGTTTRAITDVLSLQKTLLGVDVLYNGEIIAFDQNEEQLMTLLQGKNVKIIITPIGGQGCLFGRGNQQLSPDFIRRVGRNNVIVIASMEKITELSGAPFFVDTGDEEINQLFRGYIRVITGYRSELIYPVS